MQSPADLLDDPNEPAHVKALGDLVGDLKSVTLEPRRNLHVQELKPRSVVDDPLSDSAEAPHDQEYEHGENGQNRKHRNEQRQEFRNSLLQQSLKRPGDCDNEKRKGDGCQNGASQVEAGENQNGGTNAEQRDDDAILSHEPSSYQEVTRIARSCRR